MVSIFDKVSEADMRFFHDLAISVFREKAKLDAKVAFSFTGFAPYAYGAGGSSLGFSVHGVISEPIRGYYDESIAYLGKAYWGGPDSSAGLGVAHVFFEANNNAKSYSLSIQCILLPLGKDAAPFSVNGLRFDADDYILYQDGPTKEGVKKTIFDHVSEADMRIFHDKAVCVFREKTKLDAKIAFSITRFHPCELEGHFINNIASLPTSDWAHCYSMMEIMQAGSSGFSINGVASGNRYDWAHCYSMIGIMKAAGSGFSINGVSSEPLTRYDWAHCSLGMVYWDVTESDQCLGAYVEIFVTNKVNYSLEFTYVPGGKLNTKPYPDIDTVPELLRGIHPSRDEWFSMVIIDDMAPFSVNGLRFESEEYSSDPPDAFGVS